MAEAAQGIGGNGRMLARIDERTQLMNDKIDKLCADFNEKIADHEGRIRKLERNTWIRDAGAAIIGAITGLAAGLTK